MRCGLYTQCSAQAFGSVWISNGVRCQVWDNQTAQSLVHRACTVLSSSLKEFVQTNLFPSWLQFGFELLKESAADDPPPEASVDDQHRIPGFPVVRWSRTWSGMDGTDDTPETHKGKEDTFKTVCVISTSGCLHSVCAHTALAYMKNTTPLLFSVYSSKCFWLPCPPQLQMFIYLSTSFT